MVKIFEKFEHTFDIKSIDKQTRLIRGTGSFEEVDRDREIVALDAIERGLNTYLQNPIIRFKHQDPIGKAIPEQTFVDRDKGVFTVTAYISDKTQIARDAWGLIEDGIIKSFSIGGKVLEKEAVKEGGRELTKITNMELYEVSVVDIPSNRKSFFEVIAKSIKEQPSPLEMLLGPIENQDINKLGPGKHSEKWHRCVDDVRAGGNVDSPEAVCTASLGEESFNRLAKGENLNSEDVEKINSLIEKLNNSRLSEEKDKLGDMEHMTDEYKNKKEDEQCQKILKQKKNQNLEILKKLSKELNKK